MTSVKFTTRKVSAGYELTMQVKGHANYANEEPDIVCSACCMLVQALAATLMHLKPSDIPLIYTENEEKAEAQVWYLATDALDAERAASMFLVARIGFDLLAKKYPENVCVSGENSKVH